MWYTVYTARGARESCMLAKQKEQGERLKEHLADIRHGRDKAAPKHSNNDNHTGNDLGPKVLELIKDKSRYYRQILD